MAKKSQVKGRCAEIELAKILNSYGIPAKPGQAVSYGNTPDITCVPGYHIECKRREKLNLYEAMQQSIRDSQKFNDGVPVVIFRKNYSNWLVCMQLADWINLIEK